jgi:antitoxin component of MazEF toxin-antitoxin module
LEDPYWKERMKKKIQRWGNSLVILITSQEAEIYGLQEGDVIEIDDMLWEKPMKDRNLEEVKE